MKFMILVFHNCRRLIPACKGPSSIKRKLSELYKSVGLVVKKMSRAHTHFRRNRFQN